MPAKRVKLADLSNATPTYLVDLLGQTREDANELKRQEGWIKQALNARIEPGTTQVQGETHYAEFAKTTQERFDSDGTKAEMGEDWWNKHLKVIEFDVIRTTRLDK